MRGAIATALAALTLAACGEQQVNKPGSLRTLEEAQQIFGPLITTANQPTSYQSGTGQRLGFFRSSGGVWGIPVLIESGEIRVCAPASIEDKGVTDTFPAGSEIIASTNKPTGWRGGSGVVELVLKDAAGTVRWHALRGGVFPDSTMCGARVPGSPAIPTYYRVVAE
jgi:hypothetical protein